MQPPLDIVPYPHFDPPYPQNVDKFDVESYESSRYQERWEGDDNCAILYPVWSKQPGSGALLRSVWCRTDTDHRGSTSSGESCAICDGCPRRRAECVPAMRQPGDPWRGVLRKLRCLAAARWCAAHTGPRTGAAGTGCLPAPTANICLAAACGPGCTGPKTNSSGSRTGHARAGPKTSCCGSRAGAGWTHDACTGRADPCQ